MAELPNQVITTTLRRSSWWVVFTVCIKHFVETIHVELSDKGGNVTMLEVSRECCGELCAWMEGKDAILISP